jgi:hypothetical protein
LSGFGGGGRGGVHQTTRSISEGAAGRDVSDPGDRGREGFDSLLDFGLQYRQHDHHHTDNIFHVFRSIRFLKNGLNVANESGGGNKDFFYRGGVEDGLGGGVVGKEIPAEIVRGVDFGLGFRAAALAGRIGSASEKPGIIKVVPNGTVITTPAGNGGASRGGGIIDIVLAGLSTGGETKLLSEIGLRRDMMTWKINSTWHTTFVEC